MKKLQLLFVFMLPLAMFGQTIPNGNFENWNSTYYDVMSTGWYSSNMQSVPWEGLSSVTKSTDKHGGNYAVKIETVTKGSDTTSGYIVNVNGDPQKAPGGFAYSAMPTKITGYYKYTPGGIDEAIILVNFKKGGKLISSDTVLLGVASSYTYFEHTLSLSSTPDTVVIGATNSVAALKNKNGGVGSVLLLDDLAFTGSGSMPAIQDGDFETWNTASYDVVDSWATYSNDNNEIIKTTDKYKGTYAAQLQTIMNGDGTPNTGYMTNGKAPSSGPPDGGRPFTNSIDTLVFHYKYSTANNDSASVMLQIRGKSNFWSRTYNLPAESSYTYFEIPINTGWTPDSLNITFQSSKWPSSKSSIGSTFIIDEVQLKSAPLITGIWKTEKAVSNVRLYPNPANTSIRIVPASEFSKNGSLVIYNSTGQIMSSMQLNEPAYPNGIEIKLDGWKSGVYFYHLYSATTNNEGNFIKE